MHVGGFLATNVGATGQKGMLASTVKFFEVLFKFFYLGGIMIIGTHLFAFNRNLIVFHSTGKKLKNWYIQEYMVISDNNNGQT